jgi:hypothetical protein
MGPGWALAQRRQGEQENANGHATMQPLHGRVGVLLLVSPPGISRGRRLMLLSLEGQEKNGREENGRW